MTKSLTFDTCHAAHRCKHCGCKQEDHRGGSEQSPEHTCPPTYRYGQPQAFPRSEHSEDQTRDYTNYWRRIDAYWSAKTEFDPQ